MNWAEVINETLRYLEKNIMTVQGPKEVAMEVHVSSSYLQNSFQMITGYTIGEYIRSRRLYLNARHDFLNILFEIKPPTDDNDTD